MKSLRRVGVVVLVLVVALVGGGAEGWASCGPGLNLVGASTVPAVPSIVDSTSGVQVGVRLTATAYGQITALRFFKGDTNTAAHVGRIWSGSGTLLVTVDYANETASGWQTQALPAPIPVVPGFQYVVTYWSSGPNYAVTNNGLVNGLSSPPLLVGPGGGVYGYGNGTQFPPGDSASLYFADVVFQYEPASSLTPCPAGTVTDYPCVFAVNGAAASTNVDVGPVVMSVDDLRASLVAGLGLVLFLLVVGLILKFRRRS